MALNRFHVVSPLALVAFSACRSPYLGEGGSVGGAVVNGPLTNALVFLDYDFDGVLDANEPSARTDQFGKYTLTSTQSNYDLIAIADDQTVDTSSGSTFSGITGISKAGAFQTAGIFNVGHQYYQYVETGTAATFLDKIWIGLQCVIPMYVVVFTVGGLTEVIFAIFRKHEVNEGII